MLHNAFATEQPDPSQLCAWLKGWAAHEEIQIKSAIEEASSWFPKGDRYFIHVPPHEQEATWENVFILAHELGHHRSHVELKTPYDQDLIDRINAGGPSTEQERIDYFAEEERAWALGRELILQAGLLDLSLFDRQAKASLDSYRVGLRLA